jgi:hypothetical protein
VLFGAFFGFLGGSNNFQYSFASAIVFSQVIADSFCSNKVSCFIPVVVICKQGTNLAQKKVVNVVTCLMLKAVGKFEYSFIINLNLFIVALLNELRAM